jgi:protein-disulfide isomerase
MRAITMRLTFLVSVTLICLVTCFKSSSAGSTSSDPAQSESSSYTATEALDANQDKSQKGSSALTLLDDKSSPQYGNQAADVVIVEFFDYHCPYCKQTAGDLFKLTEEDSNVRIVFKEFPILSDDSVIAAKAALAANAQQRYAFMHAGLMSHSGRFSEDALRSIAEKAGVDADRMFKDMSSPEIQQEISRNLDLGRSLGLKGTPTLFFCGFLVPGAISYDKMKDMVETVRMVGCKPS